MLIRWISLLLLLVPSLSHALVDQRQAEPLHALVLRGDEGGQLDVSQSEGLELYALFLPGPEQLLEKRLRPLFMNRRLSSDLIERLKTEIVLFYRAYHHPIVSIYVPEQDVTNGVLQLQVVEGRLGAISSKGGRFFSGKRLKKQLHLAPGSTIDTEKLEENLAWINRNPFRTVDAYFAPGQAPGTTDIKLEMCDEFPLQLFAGADNTGNEVTGFARWFTGFTWGNVFGLDQTLTYQYTTATHLRDFQSHSLFYAIPLPWRNELRFFGGYARSHPHLIDFHSTGTFSQASARYAIPIQRCGAYHEFVVGFDYKNTNTNVIFIGEEDLAVIASYVNLSQFMASYSYARDSDVLKFLFDVELFCSPGRLLSDESNELYSALSPGAQVDYLYGDLDIATTWCLPHKHALFLQARVQLSNHTLLPSEQFGLGGYDTVRGYEEHEFNADEAFCFNAEIRSRPFSIFRFFRMRCVDDRFYFLLFFDYGLGHLKNRSSITEFVNANPQIKSYEYLMGFGPGFRYSISDYLTARCDWGIKLHHPSFDGGSRSMFHLGLILSY